MTTSAINRSAGRLEKSRRAWRAETRRHGRGAVGRTTLSASHRPPPSLLVFRLVHQGALLDPGHHVAELDADFFDRVSGQFGAGGLERSLVDLVLQHPVARE